MPPEPMARIFDAPPLPDVLPDPTGRLVLLAEPGIRPSITRVAQRAAGAAPASRGIEPRGYAGFVVVRPHSGEETRVVHPDEGELGIPLWAPSGERIAFSLSTPDGAELWVANVHPPLARRVTGPVLQASSRRPCDWMPDGEALLCRMAVAEATDGALDPPSPFVAGPDGDGATSLVAPYARVQIALVDVTTGAQRPVGPPVRLEDVAPSPDGTHLLVSRREDGAPWSDVEIWSTGGAVIRRLRDGLAASGPDGVGEPLSRGFQWAAGEPATVVWPRRTRPPETGDRLMRITAPFDGSPAELLALRGAFAGMQWTAGGDAALVYEYERATGIGRTWLLSARIAVPPEAHLLWAHGVEDRYDDPGRPLEVVTASGRTAIATHEGGMFLAGTGAGPAGFRPFLDRLDLRTLRRERLWQAAAGRYEIVTAVLSAADGRFLLRHESPSDPPNHAVLDLRDGAVRNLTRARDPSPELRAADRRVLRYARADGVPLAAVLHVPPGRVPGERMPLVLWAYPTNHHDSETTDQLSDSSQRFLQVEGLSPLLLATQGYAVLSPVAMPVVGDPDAANDSFVEQTVENARAAVAAAVASGVADPDRVAVIGHSYGAFMAVTLLVHTDLFRAGVAMSGSYNRTLTPLGFQTERRSLWEAPATYLHMSPFLRADRLAGPVLLIHGEHDERPGTPVEQSRMLYDAIRATNGTARLVVLPFEGHVYRARESVLHVLAEMVAWLDRHVKPPQASYRYETATVPPGGVARSPGISPGDLAVR